MKTLRAACLGSNFTGSYRKQSTELVNVPPKIDTFKRYISEKWLFRKLH